MLIRRTEREFANKPDAGDASQRTRSAGVVMLLFARLPLYWRRKFLSFGPKALPARRRRLYWTAYVFVGVSIGIMVLLFVLLN
jgi:hypothetical protein